ncbi:hypothetical protein FJT64_013005 [Amphibalanus amphitrite]|uniref:Retrotransposon gag domain-containing protein n=1 Tax=Amphibalanus amphitrite TaxID=1232801 RepID=A0A6A4V640_AMPAM|nr:hypothetical protein FJT64_013005 [Amphibalanus amphitrite]
MPVLARVRVQEADDGARVRVLLMVRCRVSSLRLALLQGGSEWPSSALVLEHSPQKTVRATLAKENRLQGLVSLLQDGALDYFASLSEDAQGNLQQTVAALEARFGTAKNAMQAHAELASIRQQPGEATRDFADRVRQAGREAYPGARAGDPSVEATVVSRFICGLREEQLRVRVLTKDPASLIEAAAQASGEVSSAGEVAGEEARTTSRPGVDGDAGDASPVERSGKQKAQEESPPRNHAGQRLSHQTPCNTSMPEEWGRALGFGGTWCP